MTEIVFASLNGKDFFISALSYCWRFYKATVALFVRQELNKSLKQKLAPLRCAAPILLSFVDKRSASRSAYRGGAELRSSRVAGVALRAPPINSLER